MGMAGTFRERDDAMGDGRWPPYAPGRHGGPADRAGCRRTPVPGRDAPGVALGYLLQEGDAFMIWSRPGRADGGGAVQVNDVAGYEPGTPRPTAGGAGGPMSDGASCAVPT